MSPEFVLRPLLSDAGIQQNGIALVVSPEFVLRPLLGQTDRSCIYEHLKEHTGNRQEIL